MTAALPALLLRIAAGTAGAYLVALAWTDAVVRIWPGAAADAVLFGTVTAFLAAAAAVLWTFAARTAVRAAAGLALVVAGLAALAGWGMP